MIITIECEFCHSFFDECEREVVGGSTACPDCVKILSDRDAAIDRALETVLA